MIILCGASKRPTLRAIDRMLDTTPHACIALMFWYALDSFWNASLAPGALHLSGCSTFASSRYACFTHLGWAFGTRLRTCQSDVAIITRRTSCLSFSSCVSSTSGSAAGFGPSAVPTPCFFFAAANPLSRLLAAFCFFCFSISISFRSSSFRLYSSRCASSFLVLALAAASSMLRFILSASSLAAAILASSSALASAAFRCFSCSAGSTYRC
mmetsp:Transcript_6375/g.28064  ORF Transcript_6375/g.28064 Transcript_6375/m.28064 type:complete len:212 (+) Transcript_6375:24-659(+)